MPMEKLMLGLADADKDRSIVEWDEWGELESELQLELELELFEDDEAGTGTVIPVCPVPVVTASALPQFLGEWPGSVRWGEGSPSTARA